MKITLERDNAGPITFFGDHLMSVDTWWEGKTHWTRLTLYAVDHEVVGWVVHAEGLTSIPGQRTRNTVTTCEEPKDVVEALSKNRQLTGPGFDLLVAVTDNCLDDEIGEYFDSVIMRPEELR